jgi:type IV pilus assembly protein PilY1
MRVSGAYTPAARLVPDPNQPLVIVSYQDQPLGTVVFGVAVAQTPSCSSDPSSSSDPYLGSHTTIGGASAASYQLVFQTGQKGGNQVDQSKTKANVQTLPAPRMTTRLDSWASVLE